MTTKRQPENEKAKRNYLQFLRDAKGRDETSIDQVVKAIERFDDYNRRRDFGKFHIQQARGFKAHLTAQRNIRTGEPLSASTVVSTLGMLKAFFIWLSGEAGYPRVKQADAEYSIRRTIWRVSRRRVGISLAPRLNKSAPFSTPCRRRRKSSGATGRLSPLRS